MIEPLDRARTERIRRRAHAVLDGRVPGRVHPLELALVVVFAVAQAGWALAAVVHAA